MEENLQHLTEEKGSSLVVKIGWGILILTWIVDLFATRSLLEHSNPRTMALELAAWHFICVIPFSVAGILALVKRDRYLLYSAGVLIFYWIWTGIDFLDIAKTI